MRTFRIPVLVAILVFLALVSAYQSSKAITSSGLTFTVTASSDIVDSTPGDGICETALGNGLCTLRAAVMEANAHIGVDTIILPAANFFLTIPGAGENFAATGDLDITESLVIQGENDETTIINAIGLGDRVIQVLSTAASVTISNVSITEGDVSESGGGILSEAPLTLSNIRVFANHAVYSGGGIYSSAPLSIESSRIDNNSSSEGGGLSSVDNLTIQGSSVDTNLSDTYGGGLSVYGPVTAISNSQLDHNVAHDSGGAIAVANGSLVISDSSLDSNYADFDGNAIYNTTTGAISLVSVDFNNNSGAMFGSGIYNALGSVRGYDVLFDSNSTAINGSGGAVLNWGGSVDLDHAVFSNNWGISGAAIVNISQGTFQLSNTTIISNTSDQQGGGIYNEADFYLTGVTMRANHAQYGGAIYSSGTLVLDSSTISGNTAAYNGGGLWSSGTSAIDSSTITINLAGSGGFSGDGGGIYTEQFSTLHFRNTILYDNHHRRLTIFSDDDCYGALYTGHYNLVGTVTNCTLVGFMGLDLIEVDPLLDDLADNGGPTQTYALLAGSPAIDAANPDGCYDQQAILLFDQRGYARHWDGNGDGISRCDIGSYEYGSLMQFFLPITDK